MNFEQYWIDALTIIVWLVILVVALGLAEIAVNIMLSIVDKFRRITATGVRL